jgi:hypothetical protein
MFLPASLVSPSIMEKARRLDQTWYIGDDFLVNYNLKVLACDSNLYYPSATEYGEHEYGAIMFRLCPTSGECSDDVGEESCTAGYGEYLVGLKDFVPEYLQLNREEMIQNDDDAFQMEELGGCRQYQADIESNYAEWEFYIGPACTADGTGVRVALFIDKHCHTEERRVTFADISAGRSLPYSDGGLVAQYCESCYSVNDNGVAGANDFCRNVYEASILRCESNMDHYSSKEGKPCQWFLKFPKSTRSGSGGIAVGWLFFAMVVCGLAVGLAFTATKKKKKEADNHFGLMT